MGLDDTSTSNLKIFSHEQISNLIYCNWAKVISSQKAIQYFEQTIVLRHLRLLNIYKICLEKFQGLCNLTFIFKIVIWKWKK